MASEALVTIRRVSHEGVRSEHSLVSIASNRFAIAGPSGPPEPMVANDLIGALAEAGLLQIRGEEETHIDRHATQTIPLNSLLDALTGDETALEPEEWPEDGAGVFERVEETCLRWSTAHRVSIDGSPVFGIRIEGEGVVWVHADNPDAPHESWTELLALHWNNADHAAVGMASYGVDGLFQIRPGLHAIVASTDEDYPVTVVRAAKNADLDTWVLQHLHHVAHPSVLREALGLDRATAPEAESEEPALYLSTSLCVELLRLVHRHLVALDEAR